MKIQVFTVGMLSTNCYVAYCPETKDAIVIDPGVVFASETVQIFEFIDKANLRIKFIINTHGHADHVSGNKIMKERFKVPICIHENDGNALGSNHERLPANLFLKDGDTIQFGDVILTVMNTPGHSPGSICLLTDRLVFTGDTLFAGGIGRTDFPGGSSCDIRSSLQKLLRLSDSFTVYPGHGPATSIAEERRFNPFLQVL
jgi:glyoxylase-like metal-dependent hydrolase (beta-lactamase superfamily II)